MKTLAALCLFALAAFARAADPAPTGPVTFPEMQKLYDTLAIVKWTELSQHSTFKIEDSWKTINYNYYYGYWKAYEQRTQDMLARADGAHAEMLKQFVEFETRIDTRNNVGFYEFMQDLDRSWHFQGAK